MRILIAGVLGGIAMFIWAAAAHVVLPLGSYGVSKVQDEATLRAAARSAVSDKPGFYVFPYQPNAPQGPSGMLIYQPTNVMGMTPPMLAGEFVSELIQAIVAAVLVGMAGLVGYGRRLLMVLLIGVAAVLCTNGSYWFFYRFPTDYTLGYMFTDFVRYAVAGLVIAALVRPRRVGLQAASA